MVDGSATGETRKKEEKTEKKNRERKIFSIILLVVG
jgi:hypothetical protein